MNVLKSVLKMMKRFVKIKRLRSERRLYPCQIVILLMLKNKNPSLLKTIQTVATLMSESGGYK